ncbi:MAG TPA: MerR family transcriptional regulator [Microlunatus sp.]
MRISELSRRSGVPTATIKYYLREGLLPAGERTAATQAQYDDDHLDRLRLIRALLGPGRLSIAEIRGVLSAVDDPPESPLELLGRASEAIGGESDPDDDDLDQARRLVQQLGWSVQPGSGALADLGRALAAIDQAQLTLIKSGAVGYGKALHKLAVAEIDTVPMDSPDTAVRQAVLGTILIEPLMLALRRLALQDAAGARFGDR